MDSQHWVSVIYCFFSISDKNLCVSISGDVDEAKALSKPPEDSQGTNIIKHACHHAYITWTLLTNACMCCATYRSVELCVRDSSPQKNNGVCVFWFHPDDESDSDAEEEQEKTVSLSSVFTPNTHLHTHTFRSVSSKFSRYTPLSTGHTHGRLSLSS